MTPKPDLDAIERRLNAATPGPWVNMSTASGGGSFEDEIRSTDFAHIATVGDANEANADLIAHAPEDLRALLAEVRETWRERDATERARSTLNLLLTEARKERDELRALQAEQQRAFVVGLEVARATVVGVATTVPDETVSTLLRTFEAVDRLAEANRVRFTSAALSFEFEAAMAAEREAYEAWTAALAAWRAAGYPPASIATTLLPSPRRPRTPTRLRRGAPPPRWPVADRHLYASDAEDNHEEPWTDSYDPGECEPADVAKWYAEEYGLDVGDHVYVIEASHDTDHEYAADEDRPIPLDVHRMWHFVVTVVTDAGCVVEEVA